MILSKDNIFAADDLDVQEVEVSEWGGSVLIRPFTIADREKFEGWGDKSRGAKGKRTGNELLCFMITASVVDEQGNRVFTDNDVEQLKEKNSSVIDYLAKEIQKLNGISEDKEEGN